jgi:hypothetical protein
VLESLSETIRECYRHAEHCARRAGEQSDPTLRQDFLDTERRWLMLARSYELTEHLSRFTLKPRTPGA